MAFTYNSADLTGATVSALRLVIGDTRADLNARCGLDDAECGHFLSAHGSVWAAAIPALDALIAKAAMLVSEAAGSVNESLADLRPALEARRKALVAQGYPEPAGQARVSRVRRIRRSQVDGETGVAG